MTDHQPSKGQRSRAGCRGLSRIRKVRKRSGGRVYTYWEADLGTVGGERRRKVFRDRSDAVNWADANQDSLRQFGEQGILSPSEHLDAVQALTLLEGSGITLADAAGVALRDQKLLETSQPIGATLDRYIEAKREAGRRPATLHELQDKLGRFAADIGRETMLPLIQPADLEDWMNRRGYTGASRAKYLVLLKGFFKWAMARDLVIRNPADIIERPTVDQVLPGIFTVDEARRLMAAAQAHAPAAVAYLAMGLFAGLRPEETAKLRWDRIDLAEGHIRVDPEASKRRRRRMVAIPPNLAAWLAISVQDGPTIGYRRRALRKARGHAKITWSSDVLRHSYASYHLAHHRNAADTAMEMGHTSATILYDHYRDLVTARDAAAYWEIRPATG